MAQDNVKSVIEALLFASDRPLTVEQAKDVLGSLESTQVRSCFEELRDEYEASNRGIRIIEIAGGFQMVTPPAHAPFLKKFFKGRHSERLSRPALETLAIIAYKQPLTRMEVESLRNVNADGVINSLLEKGLIRISGRKKAPGNPYVYGTTKHFLEYFGLKSLDELPKMEEFAALVDKAEETQPSLKNPETEKMEGEREPEKTA